MHLFKKYLGIREPVGKLSLDLGSRCNVPDAADAGSNRNFPDPFHVLAWRAEHIERGAFHPLAGGEMSPEPDLSRSVSNGWQAEFSTEQAGRGAGCVDDPGCPDPSSFRGFDSSNSAIVNLEANGALIKNLHSVGER